MFASPAFELCQMLFFQTLASSFYSPVFMIHSGASCLQPPTAQFQLAHYVLFYTDIPSDCFLIQCTSTFEVLPS
jgi:hypothetical protein